MKDAGLNEDDWIQTWLDQLNLIDEKRLTVICHGQTYQKQMIKAFNKKVRRIKSKRSRLLTRKSDVKNIKSWI